VKGKRIKVDKPGVMWHLKAGDAVTLMAIILPVNESTRHLFNDDF